MKTQKRFVIALSGLMIVVTSCSTDGEKDQNATQGGMNPGVPVDVIVAQSSSLDISEILEASIIPNKEVVIKSELSKKIKLIGFTDGSHVQEGQVLYRLENSDLEAKHKQAAAELSLALMTEHRLAELLEKNAISQEEYDMASTRLEAAKAIESISRADLEKTIIKAPFSGTIGITKVQVGQLVGPGAELVTLQASGSAKIQFYAPEQFLSLVSVGASIDYLAGTQTIRGKAKILATEPSLQKSNRSILVQAVITDNGEGVRPGMSAKVYLQKVDQQRETFKIPTEALIPGAEGYQVFSVKKGTVQPITVTIADRDENFALITSGVKAKDTIITSNTLRLMPGAPVNIVEIQK